MKSSVKHSLIAAAVVTALGSSAYALPPTTTVDATVYGGGGSAQTNAAFWAATQFLTPSTIDSYTDSASCADSGSYRVLFGKTSKAVGSVAAGKNVLFFYKFNGGSFPNGIQPQIGTGAVLAYPSITGASTIFNTATTCSSNTYPKPTYSFSTTAQQNIVPDWGITDEEVALFNTAINLNGAAPLTTSQQTAITQTPAYDNLYGVAVTQNLFSLKKSFSKPEIAGILAGTITDWGQLFDDNGNALAGGAIILLDRGSGSGSKAAGNQYFLGNPGTGGNAITPNSVSNLAGFGKPALGGGINAGYTETFLVIGSSNYQDVRETSSGSLIGDLQLAQANGKRALGILGLEFPPAGNQVGGANVYYFAKISGVGPDTGATGDNINGPHGGGSATKYTNVITGAYDFFYQNSINIRSAGITGQHLAFANEIKADLQLPGISGANTSQAFPLGVPGLLLDPTIVGGQPAGAVTGSRFGNSKAPLSLAADGSVTNPIVFGSDPL